MGSSYFYLEFILALHTLLSPHFSNPAVLALEYTLVPTSSHPTQLQQSLAGYLHLLTLTSASNIVVSGDSAGGTIILSLLLHLAKTGVDLRPGMAVLISPWVKLQSELARNTTSDYLDADNLHQYALQYCGPKPSISITDPLISPGNCTSLSWWRDACPEQGFFMMYGSEEVFAPDIREWASMLHEGGISINEEEEVGGIHAWPVAELFLSSTREKRQRGLRRIVEQIKEHMRKKSN